MPDNRILDHMLDRLYASLLRGPGLNCRPHHSRQRLDVTMLSHFGDADPATLLPALLEGDHRISFSAKVPAPDPVEANVHFDSERADVDEAVDTEPDPQQAAQRKAERAWQRQKSLLTKLRNCSEDAREYEQQTGVPVMFVGYPVLSFPPIGAGGSKRVLAPIAFVPVGIEVSAGHKAGVELHAVGRGVDLVVPNPALVAWVERETGQPLEFSFERDDNEDSEQAEQPWDEIAQLITTITQRMSIEGVDAAALTDPANVALQPVPIAADLPDQPAVLPSAVLGMFPTSNEGLLRDTKTMIAQPTIDGPVNNFIDVDPTEAAAPAGDDVPPVDRQRLVHAEDRLVALADPFQRRAVELARSADGLVVHGPPGTGKSQTITNIIGDHLSRGERVLFVCDKRTALDVVADRLEHLGLGALTAVVHDPKRDQRDLYMKIRGRLDELDDVKVHPRAERSLQQLDSELQGIHDELTELHEALMAERDDDPSFHDLVGEWLTIEPAATEPEIDELIDTASVATFDEHRESLHVLFERATSIAYEHNPWRMCLGVTLEAFLGRPIDKLREAMAVAVESARALDTTSNEHIPPFAAGEPLPPQVAAREQLAESLEWIAAHDDGATPARVAGWSPQQVEQAAAQMTSLADAEQLLRDGPLDGELSLTMRSAPIPLGQLNQSIADLDGYLDSASKWYGFLAFGAKKRATEALRPFGLKLSVDNAERVLKFTRGWRARRLLGDLAQQLDETPPTGAITDDASLTASLDQYHTAIRARRQSDAARNCDERTLEAMADANRRAPLIEGLRASRARADAIESLEAHLAGMDLYAEPWLSKVSAHVRDGRAATETMVRLEDSFDQAESVARVRDALGRLPDDMEAAATALAEAGIDTESALGALRRAVLRKAIGNHLAAHPALTRIDEEKLESMFVRYRELQAKKMAKVRDAILLRWVGLQKQRLLVSTGSRLNALGAALRRRLFVRGRRAMRLRQMIAAGDKLDEPDPLFDMCPIWMASPETVAQVFPLRQMFDVVIFDEASQCRLEEALPVLVRAKRVVIAGDPKQLPPTRFFESSVSTSESEELETEQDLFEAQQTEVDDLLAAALNLEVEQAYLNVHYRSRNADLIDFSNRQFYRSRLQAIPGHPSNKAVVPPLTLYHADGLYKDRANHAEAERIVQIVDDLLKRADPPSLGIACFNLTQRGVILDALDNRAVDDEAFARRYARARSRVGEGTFEGLFVKNLENVQGDERDHIIISTTYGPNEEGKFYRRFGPLGRAGGGRRLNVLVTRAKHEVHLVTSIPREVYQAAEPIPEGLTPNGGWLLFAYLRYAEEIAEEYETYRRIVEDHDNLPEAQALVHRIEPFSRFALGVGRQLARRHGTASQAHWGNDGFCVDLAITHPRRVDDVTVGVLCDLTRFAACPDRVEWEVYRSSILEWTGWTLKRIWTPTYVRDPQRVLNAIDRASAELAATDAGDEARD